MSTFLEEMNEEIQQAKWMELRDGFAKAALAGGLEQGVENDMGTNWWHDPCKIARRAYAIADAMLQVREE